MSDRDEEKEMEEAGQNKLAEKKEPKQPLFSDEVFEDDLELGDDDLDNLPV